MLKVQKGFILVPIVIILALIVVGGLIFLKPNKRSFEIPVNKQKEKADCPDKVIFDLPIDITKVTSILYPGQIRGGDYKAHGGFRFDSSTPEEIVVTAPIDAKVIAGARYPVYTGDIQYTFDFENDCGIRYRLGHLLTLSPKFQEIAEKFPMPESPDSRTTEVRPAIEIKKGEIIATAVGMTKDGNSKERTNTFLDWGVYDYRQKNEASKNTEWVKKYSYEIYQYAVCWFDWISKEDREKVLSFPSSDSQSGTTSDYCK